MGNPPGVFNPFVAKKKKKKKSKFKSAFDEVDTESGVIIEPKATLDGDTYVIELRGVTDIGEAADRLISLLYAVNREHEVALKRYGVRVVGAHAKITAANDELVLERSNGSICVFTGETDKNETAVFRRIGYTLTKLPIAELLSKHKVHIYRRE